MHCIVPHRCSTNRPSIFGHAPYHFNIPHLLPIQLNMVTSDTQQAVLPEAEAQKSDIFAELGEPNGLTDSGEAPDGGPRAWLVATGAAFIMFSALGYANSFGVFQEYYMTHQLQGEAPDKIAWIGSIAACLQFVVGAVAGPLFDRFGAWVRGPPPKRTPPRNFTNKAIAPSPCRDCLHICNDDDKPVPRILAVYACTRRSDGKCDGTSNVPGNDGRIAIF